MPFFLVHGAEVMLPVEIIHEAPRVAEYEKVGSTKALEDEVDALDEAHGVALTRETTYQQNLQNYHSHRLRPQSIDVGVWVLKLKQDVHSKFESSLPRPFIVTEVISGGAYRLSKIRRSEPWRRTRGTSHSCDDSMTKKFTF
jgi:hypothetical protein